MMRRYQLCSLCLRAEGGEGGESGREVGEGVSKCADVGGSVSRFVRRVCVCKRERER